MQLREIFGFGRKKEQDVSLEQGSTLAPDRTLERDPAERDNALSDIRQNGLALGNIAQYLKNDRDLVLAAVQQNGEALYHAPDAMKRDPEIVLAAVRQNGRALGYAAEELKDNQDIVTAAVQQTWEALNYASANMKNNRDIVLEAVRQDASALYYYASQELKNDRSIVLEAVRKEGRSLSYASEEMKNDRDIVLAAVQQDAIALYYASGTMKKDHDIVLAAVQKHGSAFTYAAEERRNDRDIVLAAVRQDGKMLQYAGQDTQKDREVVLAAVRQNAAVLGSVVDELKNDKEVIIAAVEKNGHMLRHAPEEIRSDRDIVLTAVRQNWRALNYASTELKNDREIATAAVQQSWRAMNYVSEGLKADPDFTRMAAAEKQTQSSQKSQGLNFLWLNLDLPPKPDPEDGSIRMPLPEEYIHNVRDAGKRHPHADINLWFDSRRLTEKQWDYLEAVVEEGMNNVHVKDLCSIPEYANEELYSRRETKKDWRSGYGGVVWLQVDAAKILISLQGDYDQRFFADLDHAHIDIESQSVQNMLTQQGLMIGGSSEHSHSMENQLWGFDRSRLEFFNRYYQEGLQQSYKGEIAYSSLHPMVQLELNEFEHIPTEKICFPIGSIGLAHAEQPGHEWSGGSSYKGRSQVPSGELATIFNARSRKTSRVVAQAPVAQNFVASGPVVSAPVAQAGF